MRTAEVDQMIEAIEKKMADEMPPEQRAAFLADRKRAEARRRAYVPRPTTSAAHDKEVARLVSFGAETKKFAMRSREVTGAAASIAPDAFRFLKEPRILVVYEVIIRNPIDRGKRAKIEDFAARLRVLGWRLQLVCVYGDGRIAEESL